MTSKLCAQCGLAATEDALFCPRCGNSLKPEGGDPLIGAVMAERYLLVERIGQGGSGTIYRGEHTTLRKRVAVKVLHQSLSMDEGALERFRREATTVSEIDNEHIVQVLDFGRAGDGRLFFAMEYLDGETLAGVLEREGRLDVERTIDIVTQIGEALMEAHALGYVHRDLRPRNVFLVKKRSRTDFVKLLDFGLAKLLVPSEASGVTVMGMNFGDPRYMSPEQARGDALDRRADIYSLGVVTYEMLAGAPPFVGERPAQVLEQHLKSAAPSLREARPDVPEWLDEVVRRALAKSPDDRFVTALKMTECLSTRTAPPPLPTPVQPSQASEPAKAPVPAKAPEPATSGLATEVMATARVAADDVEPSETAQLPGRQGSLVPERPLPAAASGKAAAGGALASSTLSRKARKAEARRAREPAKTILMAGALADDKRAEEPPKPVEPAIEAKGEAKGETSSAARVGSKPEEPKPAPTIEVAPELTPAAAEKEPHRNGTARRETGKHEVARPATGRHDVVRPATGKHEIARPPTGEHEELWFSGSTTGPQAATHDEDDDAHYESGRRNLPLIIGGGVSGVIIVAIVLVMALSPKKHAEEKHRSYDEPAVSAALAGKKEAKSPAPVEKKADPAPVKAAVAPAPSENPPPKPLAAALEPVKPMPFAEPPPAPAPADDKAEKAEKHAQKVAAAEREHPKKEAAPGEPKRPEASTFDDPFADAAPGKGQQAEYFLKIGREKLDAGDVTNAMIQFKTARQIEPRNPDAVAGLGECAFEQGDYEGAVASLKQAVKIAPRRTRFQVLLGQAFYKLGRTAEAIDAYKKALKQDPGNQEAQRSLEVAERKSGE